MARFARNASLARIVSAFPIPRIEAPEGNIAFRGTTNFVRERPQSEVHLANVFACDEECGEVSVTNFKPDFHAQYDWTTGVPDDGNEWRKFRAVPRSYPLRFPCFFYSV